MKNKLAPFLRRMRKCPTCGSDITSPESLMMWRLEDILTYKEYCERENIEPELLCCACYVMELSERNTVVPVNSRGIN